MSDSTIPGTVVVAARQCKKEKEYWLNKLAGPLPKTTFPYDRKKNNKIHPQINTLKSRFPDDLFSRLSWIINDSDPRLHMILAAGLTLLLHRYTGNNNIITSTPIYKQEIKGEFINTVLVLRNRLNDLMTFKELIFHVRETINEAVENQNYPGKALLYDLNLPFDENDSQLFDIVIMLENIQERKYLRHLHPDMLFSFLRTEDTLEVRLEYNSRLYKKSTAKRIDAHFQRLMRQVLFNVETKLKDIDLLSEKEKKQLLEEFNCQNPEYPGDKTLHELFDRQMEKTTDQVAVVYEDNTLTYGGLKEKADLLGAVLRTRGIKANDILGLPAYRSVDMIVSMLAILKAGAAYLPIDTDSPRQRINLILKESRLSILLSTQKLMEELSLSPLAELEKSGENLKNINRPGHLAYIMFTSGSTGKPKGAMIQHQSVVNLAAGLNHRIYKQYTTNYPANLRFSLVSPFTFDASVKQIWGALLNGHGLYIVPEDIRGDGLRLIEFSDKNKIDILDGTPIHLDLLAEGIKKSKPPVYIKNFVIGGEILPRKTAEQLFQQYKDSSHNPMITNMYGLTECSDVSTLFEISRENITSYENIPIGKPLPNCRVYILDWQEKIQPIGVAGELCIGGDGVAWGYLNNPELTVGRFVRIKDKLITRNKPHSGQELKLYKTGDLARWLPDGNIEFLKRKDRQVKVRGFRIEPDEIESHLTKLDTIKEAVVVDKEDKTGDRYLCAYFVPHDNDSKDNDSQKKPGDMPGGEKPVMKNHYQFDIDDFSLEKSCPEALHLPEFNRQAGKQTIVEFFEARAQEHPDEIIRESSGDTMNFFSFNRKANQLANIIMDNYDDRWQLSEEERSRYERQILLDGWGIQGQEKLKSTTVFVAGAGGIGSHLIQQLALIGIGTLIICDEDNVELSNLNRQLLHDESRIGMSKAISAKMTLNRINKHVNVSIHHQKVTRENIAELAKNSTLIFDCVDDLETKFILSEYAVAKNIPHVISAMIEINSYAAILHTPHTPCFHCLYDREKIKEINQMKQVVENYRRQPFPVASPALAVTTGFVVNEAVKLLLDMENPAYNKFFIFNQKGSKRIVETFGFKQMTFSLKDHFKKISKQQGFDWDECWRGNFLEELTIRYDEECPVCRGKRDHHTTNFSKSNQLSGAVSTVSEISLFTGNNRNSTIVDSPKGLQQKVVSLLGNDMNMVTGMLAVLKTNKIYVPLKPTASEKELADLLEKTGARLILANDDYLDLAIKIRDKVNKRLPVINMNPIAEDVPGDNLNISIEPDQTAYILYSYDSPAQLSSSYLKNYLSDRLPQYMVPLFFVRLEQIPVGVNGKVDRKALPEPDIGAAVGYTAPRDEIETELVGIWSRILGLEKNRISTHANFFDLGGQSLRATVLISDIEKELHTEIPLGEIFTRPTILQQAEYIKSKDKEISPLNEKHVVLLKKGAEQQKHLFFVHDGFGQLDAYIHFSNNMENGFNYWGIRAERFENCSPRNFTIEELAESYIQKIKKIQPSGIYNIAGWSMGGAISFEIVRQLEAKGEKTGFLGMIDTEAPNNKISREVGEFTVTSELNWIQNYLAEFDFKDNNIEETTGNAAEVKDLWAKILDYLESGHIDKQIIKEKITGNMGDRGIDFEQIQSRDLVYYLNVSRSFSRAQELYHPVTKIDTPVHYFYAAQSKGIVNADWSAYTNDPINYFEVSGDHFSIFQMPRVKEFSAVFNQALASFWLRLNEEELGCKKEVTHD